MEINYGMWVDAKLVKPPNSDRVLCVKLPKNGHMDLCFGAYYADRKYGTGWVTSGSCDNVVFWTPLPKIPGLGDYVVTEAEWL